MLKLSKLFLFLFVIAVFSIQVNAAYRASSSEISNGRCNPSDHQLEYCGNLHWCMFKGDPSPSQNDCCVNSLVSTCSGYYGKVKQDVCADNGIRNWGGCNAPESACGQTTNGKERAVDNCGVNHERDCTKSGPSCPTEPTPSPTPLSGEGLTVSRERAGGTAERAVEKSTTIPLVVDPPSSSCMNKCISLGKEKGGCYIKGGLPENIFQRAHNFFVFGSLGCKNDKGCYCWNGQDEVIPVQIVDPITVASLGIGQSCTQSNQCISGFCGGASRVCNDECPNNPYCGSIDKCMLYPLCEGSSCSGIQRGCINRGAYDALTSSMVQLLSNRNNDAIKSHMRNILEQYNLDVANLERDARLGMRGVTGRAVKINTKETGCPDFNSDTSVNFDDFFLFADNFGFAVDQGNKKFDLGNNNVVDFDDFFKFADYFGQNVQCFTPTCNDNEANVPGEIRIGGYSCGGECGVCEFSELRNNGVDPIEVIDKQGECRDGVCTFKLKAIGKYSGRGELNVNLKGAGESRNFGIRITGSAIKRFASLLTGASVFDITGFAVNDTAVYQNVNNPQTGSKSRFECGLQLNPGFCCPAGYQASSDGSRCVLIETENRYCADFNDDGNVNYVDFFILSDVFGDDVNETGVSAKVDLSENGRIDFDDFFLFTDEFGREPRCDGSRTVP